MSSANIHAGGKDDSFLGMMYWARVKRHMMLRMDFYLKLIYLFIFSLIILRLQEMVAIKTSEN